MSSNKILLVNKKGSKKVTPQTNTTQADTTTSVETTKPAVPTTQPAKKAVSITSPVKTNAPKAHGHHDHHDDLVPTGTIIQHAGCHLPPPSEHHHHDPLEGWLLCDGSSYCIHTYCRLFEVIGYTYGGDCETFQVPNLTGNVIVGSGCFDGGHGHRHWSVGEIGGEAQHTLSLCEMPAHNHQDDSSYRFMGFHDSGVSNNTANASGGYDATLYEANLYSTGRDPVTNGSGNSHNNMPPFVVMRYYIKS